MMYIANILITGGAGFIGSHLVDRFLAEGNKVTVIDNLSSGKEEFISHHFDNKNFNFQKLDLLKDNFEISADEIFHLAANPDVRIGLEDPNSIFEQNVIITQRILEAMRKGKVKKLFFTSTSAVYGDASKLPTPENYSPMEPISLYGSSKLASEVLISSYCHSFGVQGWVFRLANVIGPRSTHGVIFDFINKIRKNPHTLEILGDGNQKKSYLYISDCIDAMMEARKRVNKQLNIFNIGSEDWILVKDIAKIIVQKMNIFPTFQFTGGKRGWIGDVPKMLLSIDRIKSLGWKPQFNSRLAVEKTVHNIFKTKKYL